MKNIEQKTLTQILIIIIVIGVFSVIVTTVFSNRNCLDVNNNNDSLVSVQIVFRHGVRTPEAGALYANDPYNNYSFYPENLGDLTNLGRKNSYQLGKAIRKRYDGFLSDYFYPGIVKSFTSGYDRTQMTLQCVHAGLFPNKNSILGIPWRPVIFERFDYEDDVIIGLMASCKTMIKPFTKPTNNETIKLFKYIEEKAGSKVETYFDLVSVTNAFEVEVANGLELPDWGKSFYPKPLEELNDIAWFEFAKNNNRFGVAGLLKKITQNALNTISNYNSEDMIPKMVLFSGHDYNLQGLLYILHGKPISTTFSAHIIFELHKIDEMYGFKIFYNSCSDGILQPIEVQFCKNETEYAMFCPLDKFIWHTKWLYEPFPSCPTPKY